MLLKNNNYNQAKLGFSNLYGIDYSAPGIKLAKSIVDEQKLKCITLKEFDFLTDDVKTLPTFTLVLDKGTFDVIGMNDESKEKRNRYKENTINLLQTNGMFLIVSCNWTLLELDELFSDCKKLLYDIIFMCCIVLLFLFFSLPKCTHNFNSNIPIWRICWQYNISNSVQKNNKIKY